MKNKTIIKYVLKLFCILTIFCSFSCESFKSQTEPISNSDIEKTRDICRNLVLPEAFVNKVSDKELAKMTTALFTTQYRSIIDTKAVEEHFYNQLVPQGWKYSRSVDGGDISWYFDKGKFSIMINSRSIAFSSDKHYWVNCRYGPNRKGLFGEHFED